MWKADIAVRSIASVLSVWCAFCMVILLVIFIKSSKMSYKVRPVKGYINVSWCLKTIVENWWHDCYISVFIHTQHILLFSPP